MSEFLVVVFTVFWGWINSYFASQRGRNPYGWFFLGLLFGPFALVALFLLPPYSDLLPEAETETQAVHVSHHSPFNQFDWYYLNENREPVGPITFVELQELNASNAIDDQSYVWNETMENWKRVHEVSELKEELKKNSGVQ